MIVKFERVYPDHTEIQFLYIKGNSKEHNVMATGTLYWYHNEMEKGPMICDIFTGPEHRGKGIADLILKRMIEYAEEKFIGRDICLWTDKNSVSWARKWYENKGFVDLPTDDDKGRDWMILRPRT